jgi:hypothetical protein
MVYYVPTFINVYVGLDWCASYIKPLKEENHSFFCCHLGGGNLYIILLLFSSFIYISVSLQKARPGSLGQKTRVETRRHYFLNALFEIGSFTLVSRVFVMVSVK